MHTELSRLRCFDICKQYLMAVANSFWIASLYTHYSLLGMICPMICNTQSEVRFLKSMKSSLKRLDTLEDSNCPGWPLKTHSNDRSGKKQNLITEKVMAESTTRTRIKV